MVHAETDSLLQMLKQAQKMEELLKQVKPDSGLSVSICCPCISVVPQGMISVLALVDCVRANDILLIFCFVRVFVLPDCLIRIC